MDERLEELLGRLTASGPKCCAVSASETHEIVDLTLELQKENEELRCYVERLRKFLTDAITTAPKNMSIDGLMFGIGRLLSETPAQSLAHITEQLGCSEQALAELKAQVEEETIERCANELKEYGVSKYIEEYVTNIERKYAKDGE